MAIFFPEDPTLRPPWYITPMAHQEYHHRKKPQPNSSASAQSTPLSLPDSLGCYCRQYQSILTTYKIAVRIPTFSDPYVIRLKLIKPVKH